MSYVTFHKKSRTLIAHSVRALVSDVNPHYISIPHAEIDLSTLKTIEINQDINVEDMVAFCEENPVDNIAQKSTGSDDEIILSDDSNQICVPFQLLFDTGHMIGESLLDDLTEYFIDSFNLDDSTAFERAHRLINQYVKHQILISQGEAAKMKFGEIQDCNLVPFCELPCGTASSFDWANEDEYFFEYNGDWMALSDFMKCAYIHFKGVKFEGVQFLSHYSAFYIALSDDHETVSVVYAHW